MAMIIRDSFDFYSSLSDGGANFWNSFDTNTSRMALSNTTRFGTGQSLTISGVAATFVALAKSFATNESTVFLTFAMLTNSPVATANAVYDFVWRYYDGSTIQCSIAIRSDNSFEIWRGDASSGTLLQSNSLLCQGNIWTHYQIKVVIDGINGEVHVRKNGNTSDDFSATGLDLTTTSNNYANKIELKCGTPTGSPSYLTKWIDDLAIYSGSGSGPWNDWVGDLRAIQLMPNADTAQKNFAPNNSSVALGTTGTGTTWSVGANVIAFSPVKTSNGGSLGTSVTLNLNASITGNMVLGLYDSDGPNGLPGTLLVQSAQVTNPVSGANAFTFASSITLRAGNKYYWGIAASASYVLKLDSTTASQSNYYYNSTYSATLPSSAGATSLSTISEKTATISGTVTVTNAMSVNEYTQDGSASYVQSSNVGDYDLYDISDFSVTPTAILGLSLRAFVQKSNAGARSGQLTLKSGATVHDTPSQALSTSSQNLVEYVDTDPNTGVAWTTSGVNAAQLGPKVAS